MPVGALGLFSEGETRLEAIFKTEIMILYFNPRSKKDDDDSKESR